MRRTRNVYLWSMAKVLLAFLLLTFDAEFMIADTLISSCVSIISSHGIFVFHIMTYASRTDERCVL